VPALKVELARLAAVRAAEEGCSEAAAARAIVLEARGDEDGQTALHMMARKWSQDGESPCGRLDRMRCLLEAAGGDAARLATLRPAYRDQRRGTTPLYAECLRRPPSAAAVACLLAHGADVAATNIFGDTPARQARVRVRGHDPPLAALLELAERVGGRDAVIRTLIDTPHVLTDAPGWDVVRTMPRLQELQDAANLRIVIALWADARERRRNDEAAREGNAMLTLFGKLPREALAGVVLQLRRRVPADGAAATAAVW